VLGLAKGLSTTSQDRLRDYLQRAMTGQGIIYNELGPAKGLSTTI